MYNEQDYVRTGVSDIASPVAAQNAFINRVYGWMCAALALTGGVAWFTAQNPALIRFIFERGFFWVLIIATFLLVVGLSAMINRISASAATAAFVVYAALEGLLFSSIFLAYTGSSIATTFFATSLTFGVTSLVGYTIKTDLSGFGRFLMFGLIGFLIGSVINIFWANSGFDVFLTYAGIFLFAGLAAYDTQKIKMMSLNAGEMAREDGRKLAVVGALMLYLDFINLFLLLLRIFGGRRD